MPATYKRARRHRIHLIAYGFVSAAMIVCGLMFSFFAIFERDHAISKVWLAGPTTIAVGLVLCGKVVIDFRPRPDLDEEEESGDYDENENYCRYSIMGL